METGAERQKRRSWASESRETRTEAPAKAGGQACARVAREEAEEVMGGPKGMRA